MIYGNRLIYIYDLCPQTGDIELYMGRDVISVCCMKNDVGNVASGADCTKNIWRKYMENLLNVENEFDVDVNCPELMGPCCLISEEGVAEAINNNNIYLKSHIQCT